jgi:hypothetical protein
MGDATGQHGRTNTSGSGGQPSPLDGTRAGRPRGAIDVERLVIWVVVIVAILAIVGTFVTVGAEWRKDTPDAEFTVDYDDENKTVTVRHAGGDAITDDGTTRLELVFEDVSANRTVRVTWVADNPARVTDRGSGYPVAEGNAFAVDDTEVDSDGDENFADAGATVGFHFTPADRVRVVWTGSLQDANVESVTLAETTIGNASG